MPRGWKITIVVVVAGASVLLLAASIRIWRSANLFDREYRFPPAANVVLRLGARKSGGFMATITFGDRVKPMTETDSGSENS
jgi:hypothetical protein